MFYDRFISLCDKRGVTPVQVRKELGISQSTMASWKSRSLTPNAATLAKLADYFNVTIDYLLDISDMTGKTVTFQPFTKTDSELIEFGGFPAISEFYNLTEEAQKKALEDIRGFVEYVIEKYKKQSSEDK